MKKMKMALVSLFSLCFVITLLNYISLNWVLLPSDDKFASCAGWNDFNLSKSNPIKLYFPGTKTHWLLRGPNVKFGIQKDCDIPCTVLTNSSFKSRANALVSECNNVKRQKKIFKNQTTVLMCWEPKNKKFVQKMLSGFDVYSLVSTQSDIPLTYFWPEARHSNDTLINHKITSKDSEYKIAYCSSNCVKRRLYMVQEIHKVVRVHSFGTCFHNSNISMFSECVNKPKEEQINCVYSHFRFVLAFENSIEEDYVTEKLTMLFNLPVIPVYWGAPNWIDYSPSPNSLIDITQFKSGTEVGNYIKKLSEDINEYNKFFNWRGKPLSNKFIDAIDRGWKSSFCRICKYVYNKKIKECNSPSMN